MSDSRKKELTPEQEAQRKAATKMREDQFKAAEEDRRKSAAFLKQQNAHQEYILVRGGGEWIRVGDSVDEKLDTNGLSSAPGQSSLLKTGIYEFVSKSTDTIIRANYHLDSQTGTHTVSIQLYHSNLLGTDRSLFEPKTPGGFDKQADINAQKSVQFLAYAGFTEVKMTIPKTCPFTGELDGKNYGANTLAYQARYLKAQLAECIACGVGFDSSDDGVQKLLSTIRNKSEKEYGEYDKLINEANDGVKPRHVFNEFANGTELRGLTKQIEAGTYDYKQKALEDEIKGKIAEKQKKLDEPAELQKQIDKLEDDKLKLGAGVDSAELDKQINTLSDKKQDVEADLGKTKPEIEKTKKEYEEQLKAVEEVKVKVDADKKPLSDSEKILELQKEKEKWENILKPDQQLKDVVNDLKGAIESLDVSQYKGQEKEINALRANITNIADKLKAPLKDGERDAIKQELQTDVINKMDITHADFKEKCEGKKQKAKDYLANNTPTKAVEKEAEERIQRLESAVTTLEQTFAGFDKVTKNPELLAGLVTSTHLGAQEKLPNDNMLTNLKHALQHFKDYAADRDKLRESTTAEVQSIEGSGIDKKFSDRLDVVKNKLTDVNKPNEDAKIQAMENAIKVAETEEAKKKAEKEAETPLDMIHGFTKKLF